jgi:hypothetical protein
MPRGYRGIVIAIAGLILAGASPPAKNEKQTATANKQEPANSASAVNDIYKPYPDKYADSCYKADDHDSADLCAQWRAAIAAEKAAAATTWANWISTAGAILSFVSIVLVLIALGQTRKANRLTMKANARSTRQAVASAAETERAIEIATRNAETLQRQVEISKSNSERQLRPYVHIEKIFPETIEDGLKEVRIVIKNFGQTPAEDLLVKFGWAYCPNSEDLWPLAEATVMLGRSIAPGHVQNAIVSADGNWTNEIDWTAKGLGEFRIIFIVEYSGFGIDREKFTSPIIIGPNGPHVAIRGITGNVINK